jgi:hypothetical protein
MSWISSSSFENSVYTSSNSWCSFRWARWLEDRLRDEIRLECVRSLTDRWRVSKSRDQEYSTTMYREFLSLCLESSSWISSSWYWFSWCSFREIFDRSRTWMFQSSRRDRVFCFLLQTFFSREHIDVFWRQSSCDLCAHVSRSRLRYSRFVSGNSLKSLMLCRTLIWA